MGQVNEQIGFKVTAADLAMMKRVAAQAGAASVHRWIRDIALREALSEERRAHQVQGNERDSHVNLAAELDLLRQAESVCRALQDRYPAMQVDMAAARNALRHVIGTVAMAASGGLVFDAEKAKPPGAVPAGWITVEDARRLLRERNGYAPGTRWFHKARGRGLLSSPSTWRYCLIQRDGKGWRAYCLPKEWVEIAAPHIKKNVQRLDWSALHAVLARSGLTPHPELSDEL